jgi:sugar lactone lactonase YvrE
MTKPDVTCVLDIRADLGECPTWCGREQVLYWADIYKKTLNRFDPATGENRSWNLPETLGSFGLREGGGAVLALKSGFHFFDFDTNALTSVADVDEGHLPKNRLNDGRCDRAGRFWAGTMQDPPDAKRPTGTLYRLGTDRQASAMVGGLIVSNGLAFSPDDKILYVSDSHAAVRTIWAYDFDLAEGSIRNQRVFVDTRGMPGRPDGAAVDADGCYWMAAADGWELVRFTPAGKVDMTVKLPIQKPTMPAFGGPNLDTIYVTSIRPAGVDLSAQPLAGGLFAIDAGIKGLPEPRFAA